MVPLLCEGTLTAARYRNERLGSFINQRNGQELKNGYFQKVFTTREPLQYLGELFDI